MNFPPTYKELTEAPHRKFVADLELTFSEKETPLSVPMSIPSAGILEYFLTEYLRETEWINLNEQYMVLVLSRELFERYGTRIHADFKRVIFHIQETQTANFNQGWVEGTEFEKCFIYPLGVSGKAVSIMFRRGEFYYQPHEL